MPGQKIPREDMGALVDVIKDIWRRLRVLERPTGTQLAQAARKLNEAIAGIPGLVTAYLSGGFTTGGNIDMPSGTVVSPYARANQVTTSYVAAYINSDGSFLSTPSSLAKKQDIESVTWTHEQRAAIRVVAYRLRAAVAAAAERGETAETLIGVIGEELLAAGFSEFVVLDDEGRVFTVRYEQLALIALDGLQQTESALAALAERVDLLEAQSHTGGLPEADPETQ